MRRTKILPGQGRFDNTEANYVTLTFTNGTVLKISDFRSGFIDGLVAVFEPDLTEEVVEMPRHSGSLLKLAGFFSQLCDTLHVIQFCPQL